ncbi:MAG: DUF2937 family protein [Pseudohongiellaceae bacterium]
MKFFVFGYLRLFVFAAGMLVGIQVPGFVDQYSKRLDARFSEASHNISGFQSTARLLFGGDMQALIRYYETSGDPVFESDADSIRNIYNRYRILAAEMEALEGNAISRAMHVGFAANEELFQETLNQYSYTVPLNTQAVGWGLTMALLLTVLGELTVLGLVKAPRLLSRRRHSLPP